MTRSLGYRWASSPVSTPTGELSGPTYHPHQSTLTPKTDSIYWTFSMCSVCRVLRWEGRVKKRFRVKYDSNPQRRLVHTPKIVTQVRPFKLYATLHRTGMLQKLGGKGKTRGGGIEKATLANLRSEHRLCKIGVERRGFPG